MALTNPNTPISEQDLQDFYYKIKPYLGTNEMPAADMSEVISPLPVISGNVTIKKDTNYILWVDSQPILALVNINIYVNPQTGVDDYNGGYGFSAEKPFASISYAMNYMPKLTAPDMNGNGYAKSIFLHLYGTFTSTNFKQYSFEFPSIRFYCVIENNVVFNNITLQFFNCKYAVLRLNGSLTINITDTSLTSSVRALSVTQSTFVIDSSNATAQSPKSMVITGNSTVRNYIRGIECSTSIVCNSAPNTSIEANYCDMVVNGVNASNVYIGTLRGANNSTVLSATSGTVLGFGANSATGTTVQKTSSGGRIYTGQQ